MKRTKQDQLPEEQEMPVHNHTLKEALEAKRLAALQQQNAQEEPPERETPAREKAGKKPGGKRVLWICSGAAALVLILVAGLRLLAPDSFYKLFGIDPLKSGGVVLTIDEYEISRDEYLSYVVPAKQVLEETYGAEALAQREDLLTLVRQTAEESLFGRYTLLKWAAEYGITMDSITEEELSERRDAAIESCGGKSAYQEALEASGTTEAVQDRKLRQELVIEKLTYALATGDDPLFTVTDAQVREYYKENQLYTVKHVLLLTSDYASAVEKLESARKVLASAAAGQDFDELVKLYSEDTEKETYLDGYVCQPGEQEPTFEQAALSVEPGELCGEVVSTSYGYHVIQRIEPEAEVLHAQLDELIVSDRIAQKRVDLQSGMLVYYGAGYDNISFAGIDAALEN